MIKSSLNAEIKSFDLKELKEGIITFYNIVVIHEGQEWEVKRRFREFVDLNKRIKLSIGISNQLPSKTLFKLKKAELLEIRKTKLNDFLRAVTTQKEVMCCFEVQEFLEISEHTTKNQLQLSGQLEHPTLSFRKVCFSADKSLVLFLTSETSIITK